MDNANPLAFGMPQQALATFLQGNHAYEVIPTATNEKVERVATFVDRDILQSGWLLGEDRIAKTAAVVAVQQGQGQVVMIGFRAQHRDQTHGTFKLLFKPLVSGPEARAAAAAGATQGSRDRRAMVHWSPSPWARLQARRSAGVARHAFRGGA